MSIEQQLAALIVALQENTAAVIGGNPEPEVVIIPAAALTPAPEVINPGPVVAIPPQQVAQPLPQTTAPVPASLPVQEQPIPDVIPTGIVPQVAAIPTAAVQATPGVGAQPAAASPSNEVAYGVNDLRAETMAKYNDLLAQNTEDSKAKAQVVLDLVQRYGGGNVTKVPAEQYGNFLGELRAIA